MSILFVRVENSYDNQVQTDRFLIDCTKRQENILRRSNRQSTQTNKYALFTLLLTSIIPDADTLIGRKQQLSVVIDNLKDEAQIESNNLNLSLVTGQMSIVNSFFNSPYGLFKITKSPVGLIDQSASFRMTQIVVYNKIDTSLIHLNKIGL